MTGAAATVAVAAAAAVLLVLGSGCVAAAVYTTNGGSTDETLPFCTNNGHKDGEWVAYQTPIKKSFVCCGGGYNSIYSADHDQFKLNKSWDFAAVPGYCHPVNTIPSFLERGFVQYGAQCGDDCCTCDREDGTRFTPNRREKYYWKPRACRLLDWSAPLFCELLAGRKILLIGDSSMQQTASTLMSMVQAGNGTCAPRIVFGRSDHVIFGFKGHHNYANLVDAEHPNITVVTAGPHIDDKGDIDAILNGVFKHLHFRRSKNLSVPSVIWKTQNPGHLECHRHTVPVKEYKLNSSVLDRYRWSEFLRFDNYTDVQAPLKGFKVLHMSPLFLRPDAHVKGHKADCLHYCQPGPLNLFSNVLLQMLYNKEV
jgi:hypothetical protein